LKKGSNKKRSIVLVGGCFDVLHMGHLAFLEKAKKEGEKLVVMLESDEKIRKIKGKGRPINNQENRAKMLNSLKMVDRVIKLPKMKDGDYVNLVKKIKPAVIAVTKGDKKTEIKRQMAKLVGARLVEVIKEIPFCSSSRIIEIMNEI